MEINLNRYFANLNTLFYNVLNYHWNVTGGLFLTLHKLYNEQYDFLFEKIDVLAEIMKSKGEFPVARFDQFKKLSDLETKESKNYKARTTIEELIKQFEFMNELTLEYGKISGDDLALVDYFTEMNQFFNKQLYFLRQFLK
ncbi:Dps family protein [Haloplasma contractile]|uniref:Dps family DNA-binding stress response protein n=1 Tax=Haloplasma contractile SSD-17B TaxID=1033810 RepID=U2EFQ4_9MOLU|nr:DNA starvation/stationary phase protection protein [Haloplasma contractile]ERJ13758.1 Dps family DNA-binding stress response protein [Haloplasma contractile SSD-17B]